MGGKFITLEGCDGSGKTTQVALLKEKLRELQLPCIVTREPGDGYFRAGSADNFR